MRMRAGAAGGCSVQQRPHELPGRGCGQDTDSAELEDGACHWPGAKVATRRDHRALEAVVIVR